MKHLVSVELIERLTQECIDKPVYTKSKEEKLASYIEKAAKKGWNSVYVSKKVYSMFIDALRQCGYTVHESGEDSLVIRWGKGVRK